MPRLRQRDLRELIVVRRISIQEPDGTTSEGWAAQGHTIKAKVQPWGGRLMAEMYGQRLAYMLMLYAAAEADIQESDGVCINTSGQPDYQVVAVRRWNGHLVADLERVR